jgi:hypothetical protein
MSIRGVCFAAPRLVLSCTIKNNSYDNIRVLISYRRVGLEGTGVHQENYSADIPMGGIFQAQELSKIGYFYIHS